MFTITTKYFALVFVTYSNAASVTTISSCVEKRSLINMRNMIFFEFAYHFFLVKINHSVQENFTEFDDSKEVVESLINEYEKCQEKQG